MQNITFPTHLPNYGRHDLTGKEHAEHGESLRKQQSHNREHQHHDTVQVCHIKDNLFSVQMLQHHFQLS